VDGPGCKDHLVKDGDDGDNGGHPPDEAFRYELSLVEGS
jgi:hypothetical protein